MSVCVCEEGRVGKRKELEDQYWFGLVQSRFIFDLVLFDKPRTPRTAVARDFQYCLHLTVLFKLD